MLQDLDSTKSLRSQEVACSDFLTLMMMISGFPCYLKLSVSTCLPP